MKTLNIKVGVVDDHKLFRKGLIPIINNFNGMEVVIEAGDGKSLLREMREIVPNVVLLDINMPEMDGTETTKLLKKKYPKVKIIILTMFDNPSMITSLFKCGAHGYLLKTTDPDEVENAIHSVIDTGFYFNPSISMVFLRNIVKDNIMDFDFKDDVFLEDYELLVIGYVCEDLTSDEIAEKFCREHNRPVDGRTIDRYKGEIKKKLGVKHLTGFVLYAMRSGLVK